MSGGSTQETFTSAQQEPVTSRPSHIMVMDPETLAFVRLYTAMGAEFTIGKLKFSKDHDLFANIAIPQDVANTVAGQLNDADIGARFPFSLFIDELLVEVNRALGQIRPTGWLTITIFIVACRMAEINPTAALFFNMNNTSHSRPLTTFPAACYFNIFADPKIKKIAETRWHSKWCFMRGGMGYAVPKR
ncbi:hypothetical protein LIER_25662 [Lithospermum erythrorhizon]|uniref:Transposase (putative) gypsy type domain-containing protein n=1 Tax=Lithospermum erythrorhizon TaxID=34254 RepID=A0AAV3R7N8_LITER